MILPPLLALLGQTRPADTRHGLSVKRRVASHVSVARLAALALLFHPSNGATSAYDHPLQAHWCARTLGSSCTLQLVPLEIPSEQAIIAAGVDLIDSVSGWRQGKAFHSGTVRTFSRAKVPGDGAPWHYRVSDHAPSEATFDDFWDRLGKDKPEHEKK
jgi:hypothetical protein